MNIGEAYFQIHMKSGEIFTLSQYGLKKELNATVI